jgi:uncharacterized protein YdeI (BOF family)
MKLKLVAAISALVAIPALAHAQQGGPQDKAKTQAYCDLTKLYDQIQTAEQKEDSNTIQTLGKQADALVDKLGPEYFKMIEGLDQVDLTSSEGKEFMSILSGLDKFCAK